MQAVVLFRRVFLAVLVGWLGLQPGAEASPRRPVVLVAGDSLAVGLSPRLRELCNEYGYRAVPAAMVGSSLRQWSSWLPKKLDEVRPEIVVLSVTANDPEDWVLSHPEAIEKIENAAREYDAEVVWVGTPKLPAKRWPKQDEVRSFVRRRVANYFDSTDQTKDRAPDGIHYTRRGYDRWAADVWDWTCELKIAFCKDPDRDY